MILVNVSSLRFVGFAYLCVAPLLDSRVWNCLFRGFLVGFGLCWALQFIVSVVSLMWPCGCLCLLDVRRVVCCFKDYCFAMCVGSVLRLCSVCGCVSWFDGF